MFSDARNQRQAQGNSGSGFKTAYKPSQNIFNSAGRSTEKS